MAVRGTVKSRDNGATVSALRDRHSRDYIKYLSMFHQRGLSTDLRCHFVMGQASGREKRDFLASSDRVHHVDGGNTRLHSPVEVRTGWNRREFGEFFIILGALDLFKEVLEIRSLASGEG